MCQILTMHFIGGHASEEIKIPKGVDIVKVEVGTSYNELNSLRFHLSNGKQGGYLYTDDQTENHSLAPAENEKIIGFYGRSDWGTGFCGVQEFGIITAPKDVELPMSIYDLEELQNTDGGNGVRGLVCFGLRIDWLSWDCTDLFDVRRDLMRILMWVVVVIVVMRMNRMMMINRLWVELENTADVQPILITSSCTKVSG